MFIVALTGGIGCGKSEAANIFASFEIPIVDLDVISHQLTAANQPLVNTIASSFGDAYVTENGALDRMRMRQLVFTDETARERLNQLLHPAIYEAAMQEMQGYQQAPYIILAIPLLDQDSPYLSQIDRILAIDCDEDIQIERVKQRSNLSEAEIKNIIQAQTSRATRLEMADDIIENNGNIEDLRRKVGEIHQKYIKTCIVSKTIS